MPGAPETGFVTRIPHPGVVEAHAQSVASKRTKLETFLVNHSRAARMATLPIVSSVLRRFNQQRAIDLQGEPLVLTPENSDVVLDGSEMSYLHSSELFRSQIGARHDSSGGFLHLLSADMERVTGVLQQAHIARGETGQLNELEQEAVTRIAREAIAGFNYADFFDHSAANVVRMPPLSDGSDEIEKLFGFAGRYGAGIRYEVASPDGQPTGRVITTKEEAAAYMNELVDSHLPAALDRYIGKLGEELGEGRLTPFNRTREEIDLYVDFMEGRGFQFVEQADSSTAVSSQNKVYYGLKERIDDQLRANVVGGLAERIRRLGSNIAEGYGGLAREYMADEGYEAYLQIASRLGLVQEGLSALTQIDEAGPGVMSPDVNRFHEAVAEQVTADNFRLGLSSIANGYLSRVRLNEDPEAYRTFKLDEFEGFLALASEVGVLAGDDPQVVELRTFFHPMSDEQMRPHLLGFLSSQIALAHRHIGEVSFGEYILKNSDEFRRFAMQHGLTNEDFRGFDEEMRALGIRP